MTKEKFKQLLKKSDSKITELYKKRSELISTFQNECEHLKDDLVEGKYREGGFWEGKSSMPPFRVCRRCGLKEEGWSFTTLGKGNYDVPTVSRDTAQNYVIRA